MNSDASRVNFLKYSRYTYHHIAEIVTAPANTTSRTSIEVTGPRGESWTEDVPSRKQPENSNYFNRRLMGVKTIIHKSRCNK